MKKIKVGIIVITLLAALISFGKSYSLDLRNPVKNGARTRLLVAAPSKDSDGVLRSFNLDAGAADIGEVATGDELIFTLFDDVTITLTLGEQMPSPLGGDVFLAEASGYEGVKNAVVLRTADGLTIDVQDYLNNKVYKVISTPTGVKVEEIEPTHEGKCGCDALVPPGASYTPMNIGEDGNITPNQSSFTSASSPRLLGATVQQSDTCVDILVAYDKNAAAYANSNGGGITNFAQVAVQKMNTALANTGLDASFRFRLVGIVVNESVAETTLNDALNSVTSTDNSHWQIVRTKRDELGADIVCVLIDPGSEGDMNGVAGLSWGLRTTAIASFSASAYNTCTIRSVANGHTMTHEVGHNMGCGHSSEQETQPGPQLYDYSAGYYLKTATGSYCTIMAYEGEGSGGKRIPYFSSPNYFYEGVAVGDNSHDNTRTLSNTFAAVTAWREQNVPMTYDITFEPASGTTFDGSLGVSLIPGKIGVEIHYTLDGSDPTVDSPLYEGPIMISRHTTIKAAICKNGVCYIPYVATYYAQNDVGTALGLPELEWTVDATRTVEWRVQTTNTWDGAALGVSIPENGRFNLKTVVNGPATLEYRASVSGRSNAKVEVTCDNTLVSTYSKYSSTWERFEFEIPLGEHEVIMHLSPTSDGKTNVALDDMMIHYVTTPALEPAVSSDSTLATTFTGELRISIDCPDAGAVIYYTLDGSDPDENSILYEGPFIIEETLRVKAVAVKSGRGKSKIVEGCYAEHSLPKAGEWTCYGDGAVAAAAKDGRMIVFLACTESCGFCKQHYQSSKTKLFQEWASVNGIYLVDVRYDYSLPDTESIQAHFWPLWLQTSFASKSFGFPSYVFADAANPSVALGAMIGITNTTGKVFTYTPESLMECFASHLGTEKLLGAPVASVTDAYSKKFPFDVTLSNTNGTGTIYYTLDGSVPNRTNGTVYSDAITIETPGTVLKAAVWPEDANGASSAPLSIRYESLTDAVGMDGVSWSLGKGPAWSVVSQNPLSLRGGKNPTLTSGTSTSTIKATVSGPGIFRFTPKVLRYASGTSLSFSVGGTTLGTYYSSGNNPVEYVVEGNGETTLTWVYTASYLESRFVSYGAWLNDMSWESQIAPASPTGLAASQGTETYGTLFSWNGVARAKSYVIYRSEEESFSSAESIGTTARNYFWDVSAESGKYYNYWVVAGNEYGQSNSAGPVRGWIPATCNVTFNANGGWGAMSSQKFVDGAAQAISLNLFKNTGMRFVGWAESADGEVQYENGELVTFNRDTTLFAKWSKDMIWTIDNGTLSAVDMNGESEAFVPEGVKTIAASLFAGKTTLTHVTLPNSLTSIEREAFKGCSNLASINIPDSVKSIGSGAFDGCAASLYVTRNGFRMIDGWLVGYTGRLSGTVTLDGVKGIVPSCLSRASGAVELTIEGSIKELPYRAFNNVDALTAIVLGDGIVKLGDLRIGDDLIGDVFDGCCNLKRIVLPRSLRVIGSSSFEYCPIEELVIPDGVTSIPQNMCWGCGELRRISIPESVTTIGICAFNECTNLVDVVLPRHLTRIEDGAFSDCASLEGIDIPDSVVSIDSAFRGCEKLRNVVLPEGLKVLSGGVFRDCSSLDQLVIPAGITSIGNGMCGGCSSLESVEIKGKVTSIGWGAFQNCAKLKRIVLPESVTNVAAKAFAGCVALRFVFAPEGLAFPADAFEGCSDDLRVIYYTGNVQSIEWLTLSYDGNGGVGNMAEDILPAGTEFSLSRNLFSNGGLYFQGWALSPDGDVVYRDGDVITLNNDTVLYAVWLDTVQSIVTDSIPSAREMEPYEFQLEASGGIPPYTWSSLEIGYEQGVASDGYSEIGEAQGWQADDECWELPLPFDFPFYGKVYKKAYVSSNGTIAFDGAFNSWSASLWNFTNRVAIAAMWADINTSQGDIYVSQEVDSVVVRWRGLMSSSEVSFSATLRANGDVSFSYNRSCIAQVGISAGDGVRYKWLSHSANDSESIAYCYAWIVGVSEMPKGLTVSSQGIISGTPTEQGEYEIKVGVTDATRNRVDKTFAFTVGKNPNERPVINSFVPSASASLPTGTRKKFNVVASDPEGGVLTYRWELDGVTIDGADSATYLYAPHAGDEGSHTLVCYVSDNLWRDVVSQTWNVYVSRTVRVTPSTSSSEWENMSWSPPGRILLAPGKYELSGFSMHGSTMFEGEAGALATVVKGVPSLYMGNFSFAGLTIEDASLGTSEGAISLENCIVRNCNLSMYGGTLRNCVVTLSRCSFNGTKVEHCTICGNEQVRMYAEDMWGGTSASGVINSIVRSNDSVTIGTGVVINHSCVDEADIGLGVGNVSANPVFVDASGGDFRLRSGSPCVDAAQTYEDIPDVDLLGNARIQGASPDMGACEGSVAGYVVAKRVVGHGSVTADKSSVGDGGSITFTASGLRPFVRYETNGVFATSESVFTWPNIREDGVLTAVFAECTWYVDAENGNDGNDGVSAGTARRTIRSAVNDSLAGEDIFVAPGIYESITTSNKAVRIMATGEIGTTVIDGDSVERCVTVATANNSSVMATNTVLRGFVLKNGYASSGSGGGALGGTLQSCVISNCVARRDGGGASYSVLENCLVTGNSTSDSYRDGGGTYNSYLYGCTVVGNVATDYGGGVCRGRIYNTIVWGNTARYGRDAYSPDNYSNCCVSNETRYGISANPKFRDPAAGDWRLAEDSPCVNAASVLYVRGDADLAGNVRIFGVAPDIGAYEWCPETPIVKVSFFANGGDGMMEEAPFWSGYEMALPRNTFVRDGYVFGGWALTSDGEVVYGDADLVILTEDIALYARWIWSPFEFDGQANWTLETDGSWRSGSINDDEYSSAIMSVSGTGTLTFDWKTSCEEDYDILWFYIDGKMKTSISGISSTWGLKTCRVDGAGTHIFTWKYVKDKSDSEGSDCGWIKDVVWTPDSPMPTIADGASVEEVNAAVDYAEFADAGVKTAIGGKASEYKAFKAWAGGIAGGEAAVVASPNAAASYLLGAERLFVNAPEVVFGECEVASDTGEVTVSITIKDGEDAVAVVSEKVAAMFEATSDLGDWDSTGKKLAPTVTDLTKDQSSTLNFKVRPGNGKSPSAFLRIRK